MVSKTANEDAEDLGMLSEASYEQACQDFQSCFSRNSSQSIIADIVDLVSKDGSPRYAQYTTLDHSGSG